MVVKGYPRLSETFIAQEMLALQRRGLPFEIWALRLPTDKAVHPLNRAITAKARYLPEYLYQQPLRVLRGAWAALRMRARMASWRSRNEAGPSVAPNDGSSGRARETPQASLGSVAGSWGISDGTHGHC
jgi:hypothetical protein